MLPDSAPIAGVRYDGFPLNRPVGQNNYGWVSLADCQHLCHITDQCLFFNWEALSLNRTSGTCWLKYGMGMRFEDSNFTFGFKKRAGLNILTVPHISVVNIISSSTSTGLLKLQIYIFLTYFVKAV